MGFDIQRRRPFGIDPFRDAHTILKQQRSPVIFDVGANVGQTALKLREEFPNAAIHSFEPSPETFRQLKANVGSRPSITAHNLALGSRTESRAMHLTKSSLTSSLLPTAAGAEKYLGELVTDAGQATISVSSLDEFLANKNIPHLDLLKLDVQGFEVEVLKGAAESLKNDRISMVLTEVNFVKLYDSQAYFQDVYDEMFRQNYQLVGLYHGDYRAGQYLAWADALFVKPSAVARHSNAS